MALTLTRGLGHTAVISGTDKNKTKGAIVVDTTTYDHWLQATSREDAGTKADEAITAFFAPLIESLEALEEEVVVDPLDPNRVIVEPVAGETPQAGLRIQLDYDGQLVAAVLEGHTDRLIWVGDDLFIEAV